MSWANSRREVYLPVLIEALDLARTEPQVYALDMAVNALDALLHIDTPESRAVLAAAVDDDREAVRELAREVAERPEDFW
ncbi:hypothetical protein [Amycolatopsis solani]|uniref:hypothetical protein n=1 Tax=Amycolatopsis solani TaxID=3028615 RepID=UPI0025B1B5E5|nr:hypothetical protein [Amycolatopsis sp. MEP2-6]